MKLYAKLHMDIKLPNNVLIITLAFIIVCDAMRDLVLFVQFKKREKHPWRSVTFSNVLLF